MATRVQNYRVKPLPSGHIWVGRMKDGSTGYYANKHSSGLDKCPECYRFRITKRHTASEAIEIYKDETFGSVVHDQEFRRTLIKLRGRVLVCGCTQKKECSAGLCNGKVIASFLDSLPFPCNEEEVIAAARIELSKLAAEAVEEADARG